MVNTKRNAFVLVYSLTFFIMVISIITFLFLALVREEERHKLIKESFVPKDLVESVRECFLQNNEVREVFNPYILLNELLIPTSNIPQRSRLFTCSDSGDKWKVSFWEENEKKNDINIYSVFNTTHRINTLNQGLSSPEKCILKGDSFVVKIDRCRLEEWKFFIEPRTSEKIVESECAILRVRRECHVGSVFGSGPCEGGEIYTQVDISAYAKCNLEKKEPVYTSPLYTRVYHYN